MVRCIGCGFLTAYIESEWVEVDHDDYLTVGSTFLECFRQVKSFQYTETRIERECSDFIQYEQGFTPREHFMLEETRNAREEIREFNQAVQKTQRRTLWVTTVIGIGTTAAVVVMGILNLIWG